MLDASSDIVLKIKKQYSHPLMHPLIVHRSIERATSPGDLFDILYDLFQNIKSNTKKIISDNGEEIEVCNAFPIIWHEEQHKWVKTDDILQSMTFINKKKEQK